MVMNKNKQILRIGPHIRVVSQLYYFNAKFFVANSRLTCFSHLLFLY